MIDIYDASSELAVVSVPNRNIICEQLFPMHANLGRIHAIVTLNI